MEFALDLHFKVETVGYFLNVLLDIRTRHLRQENCLSREKLS